MRRAVRTLGLLAALAGSAGAQVTQRVSLSSSGEQAEADCYGGQITRDGRWVAFVAYDGNLVPGDTNGTWDVFLRDRRTGTTERVSVASDGSQANGESGWGSPSADGRFVSFDSDADNLVPADTNQRNDAFVRDRLLGITERVSLGIGGSEADGNSYSFSISPEGRYVVFSSEAGNLVAGDTNARADVFLRDRWTSVTERLSVGSSGEQGNESSFQGHISSDGRFVVFMSHASTLVPGDTNGSEDIFLRDRLLGTTERVSLTSTGGEASYSPLPDIYCHVSDDGRFVAFATNSENLVPGDTNGGNDVFLRDRLLGTTERVSVGANGVEGNHESYAGEVSADGRYVVFVSRADNLVPGDTNPRDDVFVRDRLLGTTELVSVSSSGVQADHLCAFYPSITPDGRFVSFDCLSGTLVPDDSNGVFDVFVRDRFAGPSFASLCSPSSGGVVGCPCANPPQSAASGCDNSSGTGGASLSVSGGRFLSSDSLVLETSGERPSALSVVIQAMALNPNGAIYGQGVSCIGGAKTRLYTKNAVGGSIRVPEPALGEFGVSARSAALGDPILAGQSRWYLVAYRDPIVLGGCPATSTFNTTQTAEITWWP